MKFITGLLCLFFSINARCQVETTYYDYKWQACDSLNASFFSIIKNTDSGWLRTDYYLLNGLALQMKALYKDHECKIKNGYIYYFYPNGKPSCIEKMVNNEPDGVLLKFYQTGSISDSAFYDNGVFVGHKLSWHRNGFLADSLFHLNDSIDVEASWFDDGTPSSAGRLLRGKQYGKWIYYHKNGNPSAIELYDGEKMLSQKLFDEDGSPQATATNVEREAVYSTGPEKWRRYVEHNLYWPPDYKFETGDSATLVIRFTITEEGDIADREIEIPLHPAFDRIAMLAITKSLKWLPQRNHNRNVKTTFRQAVTFKK